MTGEERIPWAPSDVEALRGFPFVELDRDIQVWRVHRLGHGPWNFGALFRFGLSAPRGTCYVGLTDLTAISETIVRGQSILMRTDLQDRIIREVGLPKRFRLADLTDRRAAGFGVTRDFGTDFPYDRCQSWASAFDAMAFEGLHYWARHDLSGVGVSLALFGLQGERTSWRVGKGIALASDRWVRRIQDELGVRVEDAPPSDGDLIFVRLS